MAEYSGGPEKEIPASTGGPAGPGGPGGQDTTRASGMGQPGEFASLGEVGRIEQARAAASGKLEETARRVRELGDRTAAKNRALQRARPLANNAADNIDSAARYVRERELDEVRTDLEEQVRRHPLASVAMAFLAGYTLRRLF